VHTLLPTHMCTPRMVHRRRPVGPPACSGRISPFCVLLLWEQAQAIRAIYSAYVNEWPSAQLQAQYFENVPVALWLTPDVAYVGLSEAKAVERYGSEAVGTSRADYSSTIKYCVNPRPGFVKLVYLLDGGRILGAHLFGEDTTEMVRFPWLFSVHVPPAIVFRSTFTL